MKPSQKLALGATALLGTGIMTLAIASAMPIASIGAESAPLVKNVHYWGWGYRPGYWGYYRPHYWGYRPYYWGYYHRPYYRRWGYWGHW